MNTIQALDDKNLLHLNGGIPWIMIASVVSLIHEEIPDLILGWKDYHAGKFDPPLMTGRETCPQPFRSRGEIK